LQPSLIQIDEALREKSIEKLFKTFSLGKLSLYIRTRAIFEQFFAAVKRLFAQSQSKL
jgi:hypothetical protein